MAAGDKPDKDGKQAWRRLKASAKPLADDLKNRHIPPFPEPKGTPPASTSSSASSGPAQQPATMAQKKQAAQLKNQAKNQAKAQNPVPTAIDQKAKRRLSRGALDIEARLDLHGMTVAEAHRSLIGFVSAAAAQEKKWLLVITGKGMRGEGKLRSALPQWLSAAPLSGQIAEYGPAAPNHGGDGAYYLRVRRAARP